MIIEFIGLPRAGKTSNINKLIQENNKLKIYKEDFSENPYKKEEEHHYDFWFCQKRINEVENISNKEINIFDRGIIDRLAWAKAKHLFGLTTKKEMEKEKKLLQPYTHKIDLIIHLDISEKTSSLRIKEKKDSLSQNKRYLAILRQCYLELTNKYNIITIDSSKSFEEISKEIKLILQKHL